MADRTAAVANDAFKRAPKQRGGSHAAQLTLGPTCPGAPSEEGSERTQRAAHSTARTSNRQQRALEQFIWLLFFRSERIRSYRPDLFMFYSQCSILFELQN